jgi:hypothetical protein
MENTIAIRILDVVRLFHGYFIFVLAEKSIASPASINIAHHS